MRVPVSPAAAIGLLALATVDVGLLAAIGHQFLRHGETQVSAVQWTPALSLSMSDGRVGPPAADYGEILARPVFFKSRAPYVPPPVVPPTAPMPPKPAPMAVINADPGLTLAGVMITESVRKAYLVKKADSRGTWASEGEDLMGWKVRSVNATAVKLQQQDRIVELQLYPQGEGGHTAFDPRASLSSNQFHISAQPSER